MGEYRLSITTTSGGSTTAAITTQPVRGFLTGMQVVNGGAATPQLILSETTGLARTLYTKTLATGTSYHYPSATQHKSDGTDATSQQIYFIGGDYLQVSIANGTAATHTIIIQTAE